MIIWMCPTAGCTYTMGTGVAIGNPRCQEHNIELVQQGHQIPNTTMESSEDIHLAAKVHIGGNVRNTGKIKVYEGGELGINKDLLNEGDLTINDPEKIKEILIESLKTAKSLAELGNLILKKFFGV